MADRVTFTPGSAERIAKVVRIVEAGNRNGSATILSPRGSESLTSRSVRFCSWGSAWPHGETAAITFATGDTATVTATNVVLGVGAGEGWAAKKGTAGWRLIGFDMTKQPGYAADEIQLFGHSSTDGIAQWYSITTCATATA